MFSLKGNDDYVVICLCPNCGGYIDENSSNCSICKASLVEKEDFDKEMLLESNTMGNSLFVCSNCSAFIGVSADHCFACGAKRTTYTAKIEISADDEELDQRMEQEGESPTEALLESKTSLFLCDNCGAFLGPKAVKCEICNVEIGDLEVIEASEEDEELELPQENVVYEVLSSEGALFLCSKCGAFIKPEASNCAICGAATEELVFDKSEELEPVDAESRLSNSGMIFICKNCGAFLGKDAEICTFCGTDVTDDMEYEEDISAKVETESITPEKSIDFDGELVEEGDKEVIEEAEERAIPKIPKRSKPEIVDECKSLWHKKAVALKKLGRYNAAIKSLNKALGLDPDDKALILEKADVSYERGRYEQAVKLYKHFLESRPEDISVWNKLGNALFRLGHIKVSRSCYEKALSLDANNREAIINKGYLLMKQEMYDEAVMYAVKALV